MIDENRISGPCSPILDGTTHVANKLTTNAKNEKTYL